MAIYLKINGVSYKTPNKIIVGRGEPFTHLNDDRSVARAHFMVLLKDSKLYIKDLKTESGTILNGQKIPPQKYIHVTDLDNVMIGAKVIKISTQCPAGEVIEVAKASFDAKAATVLMLLTSSSASGILTSAVSISIPQAISEIFIVKIVIWTLIFAVLWACFFFIHYLGNLVNRAYEPKEVSIGSDGFTAHYSGAGNMTFKNQLIDAWKISGKNMLFIRMNGCIHKIKIDKNLDPVINHLKANVNPGKWGSPVPMIALFGVIISLFILSKNNPYVLVGAGLTFLLIHHLKKDRLHEMNLFQVRPTQQDRIVGRKSLIHLGFLFTVLFVVMNYYKRGEEKLNIVLVNSCLSGDQTACKKFSTSKLPKGFALDPVALKRACDSGNQQACPNTTRAPAAKK
jgi:hypothetical protein